jgi:hypothetical protein
MGCLFILIRILQIKTTMRLYPPTVRMPTLQINITSVVKNVKLLSLNIRGKGDKGE